MRCALRERILADLLLVVGRDEGARESEARRAQVGGPIEPVLSADTVRKLTDIAKDALPRGVNDHAT